MNQVDLSKFKHNYSPNRNAIVRFIWYIVNVLFFKSSFSLSSKFKVFCLKLFGAKVGKGVVIKPCVNIKYPWNLKIGDYSWIGENVWIDNLEIVDIGKNVCISQGAMLLTGNHNYKLVTFDYNGKLIKIEDGVWIGAQSVVCPGVVCKNHSILSVGSVAKKDLFEYTIYSGNPAIEVKKRLIL